MPTAATSKPSFPFLIIRLWPHQHNRPADLRDLLAALKRHRAACDEVWFATEIGFPPLEIHAQSAQNMAAAARQIRALGIQPGLQIANTLGHGGLNLLMDTAAATWPRMLGADGARDPVGPCPRAPRALAYIDQLTRLYTAWQPSSLWIDDDLRMSSHGAVQFACFCPVCLRAFSAHQKKSYTRRTLVAALQRENAGALRLAWTRFNGASLAGIATVVAQATHAVAPACRLGFQQLGHEQFLYSGPDWSPVLNALARHSRQPARARLGHGYYTDHSPRQMIAKGFMIARQAARLPACVDQICPEIEGYTHNAFGKSAQGFAVESSLDLALGCNSLSYAMICSGHESMGWYETLLARLKTNRPFWQQFLSANQGTTPGGLDVRLGLQQAGRRLQPDEPPFAWARVNLDGLYNLAPLGLPLCAGPQRACGTLLHATAAAGLSDGELRRVLSGGVLMDGQTAWYLQSRGWGKWLGLHLQPLPPPLPFRERIATDRLNGVDAGREWNAFTNASGAYRLIPQSSTVRALGHYEDRFGKNGGIATALAQNKFGGRVAVFGYYGWETAPSGPKRNQVLTAADWVSRGKMPVRIHSLAQVMVVPRVDARGRLISVFFLNASIDAAPPLDLSLRGVNAHTGHWHVPARPRQPTRIQLTTAGREKRAQMPALAAWSVAYLTFTGGSATNHR